MFLLLGPDQIVPSDRICASEADAFVRIDVEESGAAARPPISIPGLLHRTATNYPDHVALTYKEDNVWKQITYR